MCAKAEEATVEIAGRAPGQFLASAIAPVMRLPYWQRLSFKRHSANRASSVLMSFGEPWRGKSYARDQGPFDRFALSDAVARTRRDVGFRYRPAAGKAHR